MLDVRLHNVSQLAGFAKGKDLEYFVTELLDGVYEHDVRLAPTDDILQAYRKDKKPWNWYEERFNSLMRQRKIPGVLDRASFEAGKTALLCSEPTAAKCHRRLVADILAEEWGAEVEHL